MKEVEAEIEETAETVFPSTSNVSEQMPAARRGHEDRDLLVYLIPAVRFVNESTADRVAQIDWPSTCCSSSRVCVFKSAMKSWRPNQRVDHHLAIRRPVISTRRSWMSAGSARRSSRLPNRFCFRQNEVSRGRAPLVDPPALQTFFPRLPKARCSFAQKRAHHE